MMQTRIFEEYFSTKELHNMDFGLSVVGISLASSGSNGARALNNSLELPRLVDRVSHERYWLA
jgi:hypothetical protein